MTRRTIGLSEDLHAYVLAHGGGEDAVLQAVAHDTHARFPDHVNLQIAPEQGALLTLLTRLIGARFAVEIGTFTGYSAICIARGLAADGRLVCFDRSEEWTAVARTHWQRAGLADRIELRLGDAAETLGSLDHDPSIDLAFIDADKPGYPHYYETVLANLAPHGLICVDNVLADGRVLDPPDEQTAAVAAFNAQVMADERVDVVMIPVADGLSLVTRRPDAAGG